MQIINILITFIAINFSKYDLANACSGGRGGGASGKSYSILAPVILKPKVKIRSLALIFYNEN